MDETAGLSFQPQVAYVYRPLDYAWAPHRLYLERYGSGRPQVCGQFSSMYARGSVGQSNRNRDAFLSAPRHL
jgi:hypothetical protein